MSALPLRYDDFAPYEEASPDLLSQQPTSLPDDLVRYDGDWQTTYTHLESRLNAARDWRHAWWTYWSKLAEYILPRRYHWLVTANLMRRGNPINQAIIDGTAGLAKNVCYTGMVEGLVPTTRPWFKLGVLPPNFELGSDEKAWLEDAETMGYLVLALSNFYPQMAQGAEDEVVFGTAPVIMYEDARNVVALYVPCAGEYYLTVGAQNTVDTLYTEQTKTVSQLVDMFGLENCPPAVREKWNAGGGSIEIEFVLCMAIEPNFALAGRGKSKGHDVRMVPAHFPYREIYWLRGQPGERPLSARGFNKKPFVAFRWATTSNDAYGRGPGMDALGDVIQLQIETRRKGEAIEKQVRPPMGADPALKNEPASINPAQITFTDTSGGKKGFWPLFEMKFDLAAMMADLKEVQGRVERYFFNHVFLAISRMEGIQPRNEREIAERKNEAMQQLGPVIGLWKGEMHSLLERLYEILERRRLLKPRPQRLKDIGLKFNFLDMVTLAQLGAQTAQMEQGFAMAGRLSEAAKAGSLPDPLRIINLDDSLRTYLDRMNFPNKSLFTEREVHLHDQARLHATQQRQAAAIPAAAQPAVDAAKTLSEIPPGGGNSVLGQILNGNAPSGPSPTMQ